MPAPQAAEKPGMRCLLLASVLAAPWPVMASTHWLCGLSADLTRIVCVADEDPTMLAAAPARPATALVNGTRFPLDPRRTYTVPMWSPASDRDRVESLANATLCHRSPGCEVTLVAPMLEPARGR
jgi:hypothetical protein